MRSKPCRAGFTLVEMLVSIGITVLILGMLLLLTDTTSKMWKSTTTKIDAFQSARAAFEEMTHLMGEATLNTYYNYFDTNGGVCSVTGLAPASYRRYSEMHFISGPLTNTTGSLSLLPTTLRNWSGDTPSSGSWRPTHGIFFQSPLGFTGSGSVAATDVLPLDKILNACGFYIEYNSDKSDRPAFLTSAPRYRFRLMQLLQPSENLEVYNPNYAQSAGFSNYVKWFQDAVDNGTTTGGQTGAVRSIAENIVALVLIPELSPADSTNTGTLTTNYLYDSRTTTAALSQQFQQLPPMIHVTMVAVDEPTAIRLCTTSTPYNFIPVASPPLFSTVANYATDLASVEANLASVHANYRVFSTDIAIRGSKWTAN